MKIKALSLLIAAIAASSPLVADKTWNTNDGSWEDAASWDPSGAPTTSDGFVYFDVNAGSTAATVDISVNSDAIARHVRIGNGKTVNINFAAGSSLNAYSTNAQWQVNAGTGDGVGPSHLNFFGPASGSATLTLAGLMTGTNTTGGTVDNNSVTLSGENLSVTRLAGSTGRWLVGRYSNNDTITVQNGVQAEFGHLIVAQSDAPDKGVGNRFVVDNANVTLLGAAGNSSIAVGSVRSGTGSTSYANGLRNNSAVITNNGTLNVTSGMTSIGATNNARSNYMEVSNGGRFNNTGGGEIRIGNEQTTNRGGNALIVKSNARIFTNGQTQIHPHASSGQNDGANRLVIADTGTFASSSSINNHGLIQLHRGGSLVGQNEDESSANLQVDVESGGRFEAAGEGLGDTVTTTVKSGGTFTVHLEDATTADTLVLNAAINFNGNSIYEVTLFAAGSNDIIQLGNDGGITIDAATILKINLNGYAPSLGDSWTLFTGQTENIIGSFDHDLMELPTLDNGLSWDLSALQESGNWQLSVIPEARTYALTVSALSLGLCLAARGKLIRRKQ